MKEEKYAFKKYKHNLTKLMKDIFYVYFKLIQKICNAQLYCVYLLAKISLDYFHTNCNLSLRLILKFEQKYKHLDGYIYYAHLLLCQLNIV